MSKRLRELGIRISLGAQRKEVLRVALGRVFRLLAIGSAVGLLLGLSATKLLSFIVYQATPRDPVVLGGVVLTMLLLGLLSAAWLPAQRGSGGSFDFIARGLRQSQQRIRMMKTNAEPLEIGNRG